MPDMVGGRESQADAERPPADLAERILTSTLTHVLGSARSWLMLVEGNLRELESLRDERADRVVEAMRMTLATPATPGTLRHVERAASELLRALCDDR